MVENDIYNNKKAYESFKFYLEEFALPPSVNELRRKYYCRNSINLKYFRRLFSSFEARDLSYIRRIRIIGTLKAVCFLTEKDLAELDRTDIEEIMAYVNREFSPQSVSDFVKNLKVSWKILFPECDERGRADDSIVPYVVRNLSRRIDKSRQKLRKDRLSVDELNLLLSYFSNDARLQAYLSLAFESLGRPQEMLYCRIRDVKLFENYAKVELSEHTKEGVGFLVCIDSLPYLIKWLEVHPLRHDNSAFLFINLHAEFGSQLKPDNINKYLKKACRHLGIDKRITCYSLKRAGVTYRRVRGDSDLEIQHAARWTSTRQLQTYDLSCQEDALKAQLAKRGLLEKESREPNKMVGKTCSVCGETNGFGDELCRRCKRLLDKSTASVQLEQFDKMEKFIELLSSNPEVKKAIKEALN